MRDGSSWSSSTSPSRNLRCFCNSWVRRLRRGRRRSTIRLQASPFLVVRLPDWGERVISARLAPLVLSRGGNTLDFLLALLLLFLGRPLGGREASGPIFAALRVRPGLSSVCSRSRQSGIGRSAVRRRPFASMQVLMLSEARQAGAARSDTSCCCRFFVGVAAC